ncbi:L,D-transpeptidase [Kineococcus sp. SYSU DK003]|uniref:L,D-transpeptidase n=1 Tax=Kineococcus sp. SYSU DK003 TaxID=3383124 RepID=UPI003D7D449B
MTAVSDTSTGSCQRYPSSLSPRQGIAMHGTASAPAFAASHGCARVTNAAMDVVWAHNLMPQNSLVVVR